MLKQTKRSIREWLIQRIHDVERHLKSHDVELKVITDRVLSTDERLENHDELSRTFTEKIIKLDERLSSLEDKVAHSAATNAIREDLRIYENNTKVFDLIAENQALRSLVKQYEEAYGPIADKNKGK